MGVVLGLVLAGLGVVGVHLGWAVFVVAIAPGVLELVGDGKVG